LRDLFRVDVARRARVGWSVPKDECFALEQTPLGDQDRMPNGVRIRGNHTHWGRASVLEQRADDSVQAFDFAKDPTNILFDDGIVAYAKAEQLRSGRDAEERIAKLARDSSRHFANRFQSRQRYGSIQYLSISGDS
jgi:hypothetical protein